MRKEALNPEVKTTLTLSQCSDKIQATHTCQFQLEPWATLTDKQQAFVSTLLLRPRLGSATRGRAKGDLERML